MVFFWIHSYSNILKLYVRLSKKLTCAYFHTLYFFHISICNIWLQYSTAFSFVLYLVLAFFAIFINRFIHNSHYVWDKYYTGNSESRSIFLTLLTKRYMTRFLHSTLGGLNQLIFKNGESCTFIWSDILHSSFLKSAIFQVNWAFMKYTNIHMFSVIICTK